MTALANLQGDVDATGALIVTVVAQTLPLSDVRALANLQGRVDATGALVTTGGAPAPLNGAGAPVSGQPGIVGQLYLDTSQNPNVVYINVGTALLSSWMSLLSGNVV